MLFYRSRTDSLKNRFFRKNIGRLDSFSFLYFRVIGMDVWHGKGTKSIAGVVASFNPALTRYYSETAEQPAQGKLVLFGEKLSIKVVLA